MLCILNVLQWNTQVLDHQVQNQLQTERQRKNFASYNVDIDGSILNSYSALLKFHLHYFVTNNATSVR